MCWCWSSALQWPPSPNQQHKYIHQEVTLFLNVHENKNNFVPVLRIGWEKCTATICATSAFLATEQVSITEMLIGKDVWRPLLPCPTQNTSGIDQDHVNHGFDRRVLKISLDGGHSLSRLPVPAPHQPLEEVFAEPDPPQAQILALPSFFYHLWLLRSVWLHHLWNYPSQGCKLLLKCTLAISLLDKKNSASFLSLSSQIPKHLL